MEDLPSDEELLSEVVKLNNRKSGGDSVILQ